MVSGRHIGLVVMIGSAAAMMIYVLAVIFAPTVVLQLTALAGVLGVLGILTWVGYTMFTEPPPPEIGDPSLLDDLQPETINAEKESGSGRSRFSMITDAEIGEGTVVRDHVNLYRCRVGRNCKIESFVYIEEGVTVGDGCKIKPHVYIPSGVTMGDEVFVGPNVTFTNDKYPQAKSDWKLIETVVGNGASIGANSVILPGVRIGRGAMVGAGSVVTADVPEGTTVCGNPARPLRK